MIAIALNVNYRNASQQTAAPTEQINRVKLTAFMYQWITMSHISFPITALKQKHVSYVDNFTVGTENENNYHATCRYTCVVTPALLLGSIPGMALWS